MNEKSPILTLCDKVSMVALSLFALECVLGSSGRWLSFGSISIRMVLFILCFAVTLPNVISQIRKLFSSPNVILALGLCLYLVVATVIGWKNGNSLQFIKADITSYLTLALLPGFLATVSTNKRLSWLLDMVYYGALALGVITVAIHFYLAFADHNGINGINDWLNDHAMGGLANLGHGVLRVYMRSQIFLQVGLLLGIRKIWTAGGCRRWLYFLAEGLLAYGCLMTYTRGFWMGFAISAVLLLILEPIHWKKYLSTVGVTLLVIIGLFLLSWLSYGRPVAAQEFVARFNPDLIAGIAPPVEEPPVDLPTEPDSSDANEAAVVIRQKSLARLYELIGEKPILGNGLGTNLDGIRTDGKVEYMYHDTFMKLGLVGFALFCGVFFLPVIALGKGHITRLKAGKDVPIDSPCMEKSMLLAAFLGVAITSYVNPFLINPMGILLVLLMTVASKKTN